MAPRTITLAEPAAAWIDDRVNEGGYPDADAYVAALVEHDRDRAEKLAALHAALDAGEASGPSGKTIEQIFEEARHRHAHRLDA